MQKILLMLLPLLTFYGCYDTTSNKIDQDQAPFTISRAPAFTPNIETSTVPITAQIILYASTQLNPITVTESSVYIQNDAGERLSASVTLNAQSIIIQPTVYLTPNSKFQIIITTALQNRIGAHLSQSLSIPFLSGDTIGDTIPPVLLGNSFHNNGDQIHPNTTLYFQFDEPISPLSVTDDTIRVYIPDPLERVPGTIGVTGNLLYFKPSIPFSELTSPNTDAGYGIYLDTNGTITDLSGNVNIDAEQYFEDYPDLTAPPLRQVPFVNTNTYNYSGNVYAIENIGSTLFIGGSNGLQLCNYDAELGKFTPLSSLNTTAMGDIYSISIESSLEQLYLATSKGVVIIDINDLNAPKQLGFYTTTAPVYGVDRFNDHLYLAATLDGMIDLNISNLASPQVISSYPTQGTAFSVLSTPSAGYGDYVSLSDFDNGMILIDPTYNSTMDAIFGEFSGQIRSIIQDKNSAVNYLALSSVGGVYRYDLQSTPPPYLSLMLRLPSYAYKILSRSNQQFYVSLKDMGIALVDYQVDPTITKLFNVPFEITTYGYVTNGVIEHLIVTNEQGVLYAIDALQ